MNEIALSRRRFGYRRIGILLERKGMIMNAKKLYRIYREEGLSVRRRRGRKRARGSRTPMPTALRPNQRWSMDFVSDTFGASRKLVPVCSIKARLHRNRRSQGGRLDVPKLLKYNIIREAQHATNTH